MKGATYLVLLVALSSASAFEATSAAEEQAPITEVLVEDEVAVEETCTYWCLVPNTTQEYICCDDGNPFTGDPAPSDPRATQAPSNCYYYCAYGGEVYCCADTSRPIPESHANNPGKCADEEDQACKGYGIFLNPVNPSKKYRGKTAGAIQLADGEANKLESCASDGYCKKDEKCCPSKCAKRHICLKALHEDDQE